MVRGTPRAAGTYRGARRNAWRAAEYPWISFKSNEVKPVKEHSPVRPNKRDRTNDKETNNANVSIDGSIPLPAELGSIG